MAVKRVAVAGGGLAGLSAAIALKAYGAHVELFERGRLLGGRATSFEVDGIEVDNGQHVFLACCTEFIAFAHAVGMEGALQLQERFEATVLDRSGRTGVLRTGTLPAPLHLGPSFLQYGLLRMRDKLEIARALVAAMSGSVREGESFEMWLRRNGQGQGARRAFWDPFFIPAINAPFDRVGAADAMFVLRTAFLRDPKAARFGFSRLPLAHLAQAAAGRLDAVHTSKGVGAVARDGEGVRLRAGDRDIAFDAVVIALPPRQTQRVLGEPAAWGVEHLATYDPFPIVDVHCWHDGGPIGIDFAAALESPLQWIFEKTPGYLCCSFSAAEEYLLKRTAELEALAWSEIQSFLPQLRDAKLTRAAVTRNPEATWLPRVGCQRTLQRTNHPRVAIAGSWTDTSWPDTMESAVRSGRLAAEAVAA